jgi:hypothetical protein
MAEDFDSFWKITSTAGTSLYLGAGIVGGAGHLILKFLDPYTNKEYKGTYYGAGVGAGAGVKWAKGAELLEKYFLAQRAAMNEYISNHAETDIYRSAIAPFPPSRINNTADFNQHLLVISGSAEFGANVNYNTLFFHSFPHSVLQAVFSPVSITGIAITAGWAVGMVGAQVTFAEFHCTEFISV